MEIGGSRTVKGWLRAAWSGGSVTGDGDTSGQWPTFRKKGAWLGVRQKASQPVQPTFVLLTASYRERSMTGISFLVHPHECHAER